MRLTIGVTGHRDLVPREVPALREQVRAFFMDIDQQFPGLELQLVSPLAEGSDLLVAEVARELGIPLIAALPFEQSEYEKDFQSQATLEGFRTLLGDAKVITLPLVAGNSVEAIKAERGHVTMPAWRSGNPLCWGIRRGPVNWWPTCWITVIVKPALCEFARNTIIVKGSNERVARVNQPNQNREPLKRESNNVK